MMAQRVQETNDLTISWWGMDGFLIVLYAMMVGVIFYAITVGNDFILGWLIPYGVIAVATLIFLSYLWSVYNFIKTHHEQSKR